MLQRTDSTTGAGRFRCWSDKKLAFFLLRSAASSNTARPVAHLPVEDDEAKLCWCPSKREILHLWKGRAGREVAQDRHWSLSSIATQGGLRPQVSVHTAHRCLQPCILRSICSPSVHNIFTLFLTVWGLHWWTWNMALKGCVSHRVFFW